MKLFNEMAVIGGDSLDPGPERLAGFCHGVPVKGPHQRDTSYGTGPPFFCETLH
jgi:hypothetical protein